MEGPDWTLCDAQRLTDGRTRYLVRRRGGRLLRLTVAARNANAVDATRLIERALQDLPELPNRD